MTTSFPPISYPSKPVPPFTAEPPRNSFPGFFPDMWKNIKGKPYITVSSKGLANGLSEYFNDGADFGPDSLQADGSPTQTGGIQEACEYSYGVYGYTHIKILDGVYNISNTIYLHSDHPFLIEGVTGEDQTILSTIQQNAAVPIFQNYGSESSIHLHILRNFVINLNIGTSTIKSMNFVNTTGFNISSIHLDNVRFNTNNQSTTGNYSLYNNGAFLRVYYHGTSLGNSNDFTLYTVTYEPYPSALWVFGDGYIGDIVASMRYVYISNTNWYGNLTLTDTGTTPLAVNIHDIKYDPQTTLSATSMITVNSNLNKLAVHHIDYLVYQNLTDLIQFTGTSSTSITINSVDLNNISFVYYPPATGTYSANLYSLSYATVNELRTRMVRALSDKITLTGINEILPTPTLSANPPVSGTVYQNTNPYDIEIDLPVYATTSGTAGYVTIAKGSTDTPTAISNQYVSGDTSSTSTQIIRLRVPAGWYYEFTESGVTFATATPFAE